MRNFASYQWFLSTYENSKLTEIIEKKTGFDLTEVHPVAHLGLARLLKIAPQSSTGTPCAHDSKAGNLKNLNVLSGNQLVCSYFNTVQVMDISDYIKPKYNVLEHDTFIRSVVVSEKKIVSADINGTVKVWDVTKPFDIQCTQTLQVDSKQVLSVAALFDKKRVATASGKTVKVWDIDGGNCLFTLQGHLGEVLHVDALSDKELITLSKDNTIKVWNLSNTEEERCTLTIEPGKGKILWSLKRLKGNQFLCSYRDNSLDILDLSERNKPRFSKLQKKQKGMVRGACLCDGRLVTVSYDTTVKLWDLALPEGKRHTHTLEGIQSKKDLKKHCCITLGAEVVVLPDNRVITVNGYGFRVWDYPDLERQTEKRNRTPINLT